MLPRGFSFRIIHFEMLKLRVLRKAGLGLDYLRETRFTTGSHWRETEKKQTHFMCVVHGTR